MIKKISNFAFIVLKFVAMSTPISGLKCPDHLAGGNIAFSDRTGCLWADYGVSNDFNLALGKPSKKKK